MPMKEAMADALARGENFSHFGPEANLFDKLEERSAPTAKPVLSEATPAQP